MSYTYIHIQLDTEAIAISGCMQEAIFDWSGKVSMYDDVIDLWAWHFICSGIATPGLARALA